MSSSGSISRSAAAPFFVVSAVLEIGAGVALLAAPDFAIRLIFDSSATEAGVALGRIAGGALLSLGAACWLARHDGMSVASSALMTGMLIYNAAVAALVITGILGPRGLLLSGVALLHVTMAVWCVVLLGRRRLPNTSGPHS